MRTRCELVLGEILENAQHVVGDRDAPADGVVKLENEGVGSISNLHFDGSRSEVNWLVERIGVGYRLGECIALPNLEIVLSGGYGSLGHALIFHRN